MARDGSVLGDARRDERAALMVDRIVSTGSLVLRDVGGTRAGEIGAHRLLSSESIAADALLIPHVARTAAACAGRRVVAAQDTSEINFARSRRPAAGLGSTGNAGIHGFFVHPVVAIDAEDEALLGIAGARIWTRGEEPTPMHHKIPYDEKESRRWLEGAELAATHLAPVASQVVVVADRESDIYPLFARRPRAIELVVRAASNRVLTGNARLFTAPAAWPILGTSQVKVAAQRVGEKARTATVTLKAGAVTIQRPKGIPDKQDADSITLGLVEVCEETAPEGVRQPLLWRLVTTLPIATLADVQEVVRLYRLRWRIEEVFRTLKSDGLNIEDSQLETAGRLFNLAALALVAATRIIQLVDARDGSSRPATDILDADEIAAAAAICAPLEGKTDRQKNHHAQGSLAWLAWIVARLGGWNCYYKPPGPKTMAKGLERLQNRIEGFKLSDATANV